MLDLDKILAKVDGKEELKKQLEAEIGKEYVPRSEFNQKNEELKTANTALKERDAQLENLSTLEGDKAALQAQIKSLKDANKAAAESHANALKALKVETELEKQLSGQFLPDAIGYIKSLVKKESIIVNEEDGTILGIKEQIDQLKEKHQSLLVKDEATPPAFTKGAARQSPPTMTKEQILAIPDTISRQRAIAQNIELFGGNNNE